MREEGKRRERKSRKLFWMRVWNWWWWLRNNMRLKKKKFPKIVKVASCDWGDITSNFFHEMLRWFVLPYSKSGNDYLHLKWMYFLIKNTQLLLYTNFKCIFLVKKRGSYSVEFTINTIFIVRCKVMIFNYVLLALISCQILLYFSQPFPCMIVGFNVKVECESLVKICEKP